jgi:hypothetical protein
MTNRTWKGWVLVESGVPESQVLREAKRQAAKDHLDTPLAAMMTPMIRREGGATRVLVIGKPDPSRPAPKNTRTERVIAERDGRGWLVMWPDGSVNGYRTKRAVLAAVRERLGNADVLVSTVEWRQ